MKGTEEFRTVTSPAMLETFLPGRLVHGTEEVLGHIREGRFQRSLALIAGLSSILSGLEVTYEHYRGSYSFTGQVEGNPTRMTTHFKGDWVGANCGDIKPYRLRTQ